MPEAPKPLPNPPTVLMPFGSLWKIIAKPSAPPSFEPKNNSMLKLKSLLKSILPKEVAEPAWLFKSGVN